MTPLLIAFTLYNLLAFIRAFIENKRGNQQKLSPWLLPQGSFVYGDALVLAPFWVVVALVQVVANQPAALFLLAYSLFWVVRSFGEVVYWLNEQFTHKPLNKPKDLPLYRLYKSEATYYGMQLVWQCVAVVALICSMHFAKLWLEAS